MKNSLIIKLLAITFILLIISCNSEKTENKTQINKIEKLTLKPKHIVAPYSGSEFAIGDTIFVETQNGDPNLDSVIVDVDGLATKKYSNNENKFVIITNNFSVGKHSINVQSFKKNQREQENIVVFFKSDIEPKKITAKIIKTYPHSEKSYTQGLTFDNGNLYEGTGQFGESALLKVNIETGKAEKLYSLPSDVFGEGIVVINDKIIQLTWQSHKAFEFNKKTFELINTFTYDMQGWGITNYGENLIMSDGSNILYVIDAETFSVIKQVQVYDNKSEIRNINELENINGKIYANIYLTNTIVIINPETGKIESTIDLTNITPIKYQKENDLVLNGIAYNKQNGKLYITGKRWDTLFEIKLSE